jgi:hypothetical protein
MPDAITISSPQLQIDAVAKLCNDVGNMAGMVYTCGFSFLFPTSMATALENSFHYNAKSKVWDPSISVSGWHKMLKEDLDNNRPVLYGDLSETHSYVVDGWKQVGDNTRWHINYGWGRGNCDEPNGCNTWYSRDSWPINAEIVQNIKPAQALGSVLSPKYNQTYSRDASFPYRYFDQDCINIYTATFEAGQDLQFLPGVKLTSRGSNILFEGTSSENTRLYSIKGTQSAGIKIYNGAIELYAGGGLTFLSRQVFTD